jgi:hypothetical protein
MAEETGGIMWLKMIFFALLTTGFLFACVPLKQTSQSAKSQKIELAPIDKDSTEYELIIIDPGFSSWFTTNRKPEWYYTKDYLATWNNQYVVAWNAKVRDPLLVRNSANNPFILEIDYRPTIDYGLDLNYKLYHYFKYIESTWGKILPFDRQN